MSHKILHIGKNHDKITISDDGVVVRHELKRRWDGKVFPAKELPHHTEKGRYVIVQIRRKNYYLHRLLAQAFLPDFSDDMHVDHIDGNKENNNLSNLRMIPVGENNKKFQKKRKNCTSKYRGVSFRKDRQKWGAAVQFNGKQNYLGNFSTELEAAKAYDEGAIACGYANEALNFPR